ncbi:MAG: Crp/Fnr family transcriptional regulator [Pseudobdellovibrio sp.]
MSSITKETFKSGDFIFFEGDLEAHFYIIESGQVIIFTKDENGHKVILATLNPGDTFGEFALIDSGSRTASAMAATDVKVMKISQEGYDIMLNELPLWASSMLKSFSTRLKSMNAQLKNKKPL